MANRRELVKRRSAVRNIRKITRTMALVYRQVGQEKVLAFRAQKIHV